jgi:hypothetical protein
VGKSGLCGSQVIVEYCEESDLTDFFIELAEKVGMCFLLFLHCFFAPSILNGSLLAIGLCKMLLTNMILIFLMEQPRVQASLQIHKPKKLFSRMLVDQHIL